MMKNFNRKRVKTNNKEKEKKIEKKKIPAGLNLN